MIVTIIILLLLVLLIKTATDGNTLSFIILIILLGLGIIAALISNPIIAVIIAFIVGLYYILRPSNNTKKDDIVEDSRSYTSDIVLPNDTKKEQPKETTYYSDFQKELSQKTISPEEADTQKWEGEQKQIIEQASKDYRIIKSRLLEKAQNGQYRVVGNKKCVDYSEVNYYINKKINIEGGCNFSKRILSSQTVMHPWKRYSIQEQKQVEIYKQTIFELAHKDNIKVRFYYISRYIPSQQKTEVSLPIRYDSNQYEIKAYWECSVLY